jgi:hypothetical protein
VVAKTRKPRSGGKLVKHDDDHVVASVEPVVPPIQAPIPPPVLAPPKSVSLVASTWAEYTPEMKDEMLRRLALRFGFLREP